MTNTPNLNIAHLQPNSDQPEVPINTAEDALDAKATGTVIVSIGTASPLVVTLTQDEQAAGSLFVLQPTSPGPGSNFTIHFAAFGMGVFSVYNATAHTATLAISGQAMTAPTLSAGTLGLFQSDGTNVRGLLTSSINSDLKGTASIVIDGAGSAITTGVKGDLGPWNYDLTITENTVLADQSGSISLDLWVDTYANFPPTVADSIVASAPPSLSSAAKSQDSTLTGWSKTIAAGKILRVNVTSASTVTRVTLTLNYTHSA